MLLTILCVAGAGRRSKYEYGAAPNQGLLSAPQRTLGCRWYNSGYYAPGLHHVNWALNSKLYSRCRAEICVMELFCFLGLISLPGHCSRSGHRVNLQSTLPVLVQCIQMGCKKAEPSKSLDTKYAMIITLLRLGQARVTVSQSATVAV